MMATKKSSRVDRDAKMRQSGYIPAQEVAKKLGLRGDTPVEWIKSKKVEGTLLFHKWYIVLRSLIKYIGEDKAIIFGLLSSKKEEKEAGK